MSAECFPVSVLPHGTRLYADYLEMNEPRVTSNLRQWYGSAPMAGEWLGSAAKSRDVAALADALNAQSIGFEAGPAVIENIERLRHGARAVVTGQQVGLFGGPLLTLLKAATAIARAKEATAATGIDHIPVFWLASEDHDLEEVDQLALLTKSGVEKLRVGIPSGGEAVGGIQLGDGIDAAVEQAEALLGYAPISDLLRELYKPGATLAGAFARLLSRIFNKQGLIVMDAAGRDFHRLGAGTLRAALEQAETLEVSLLARSAELVNAGYHAQVLVKPGASLLFLLDEDTGVRQLLRWSADGVWKAGAATYSRQELLEILERTPERLSPNALLRPVFQDTILPTAAYIGGPAEVAYFAQSAVLYEAILGRVTAVLPRLSATIVEPAIGAIMAQHELSLKDVFEAGTVEELTQRLGARAMPIEGKRKLAKVGNAMDSELEVLTTYLTAMDASLGRSAVVSANKMRYQINRLRRMAATFEAQKESSLKKHASALIHHLFPEGHPQERVVGGVWFLAQFGDAMDDLVQRLVAEAETMCTGHAIIRL